MILCGVCKGEKTVDVTPAREPVYLANGEVIVGWSATRGMCGTCGGSGLDAKGVQAFAEIVLDIFGHPYSSDAAHASRVERLRRLVGRTTEMPEDH